MKYYIMNRSTREEWSKEKNTWVAPGQGSTFTEAERFDQGERAYALPDGHACWEQRHEEVAG